MKFLTKILLVITFSVPCFAQSGSIGAVDARSMGMGKTYNATATGVYAIGINPADIFVANNYGINIATVFPLPEVSVRTGTNFITLDDVNYFFGGVNGQSRLLTDADKQRFDNLFANGGFGFADATVTLFSISMNASSLGAIAFSVSDYAGARVNFPRAIVDIALNGNSTNTVYSLNDSDIKSWWIRNYSVTFAKKIEGLFSGFSAGVTLKYVQGFSYAGTDRINTSFQSGSANEITGSADLRAISAFSDDFGVKYDFEPDSLKKSSNIGLFPKPAGTGYGVDLGVSALIGEDWKFSLAVTDIGSINWDANAAEYSAFGQIKFDDPTNKAQRDSLKDQIVGKGKRIAGFSTRLATALRFGVSHYFFGNESDNSGSLLLAFDFNQGFNDMPGNSKKARISVGMEWKPLQWIPYLRSGISVGGETGLNWALGLGMDAGLVDFNFSTSNMETFIAPNYAKQVSVAFSSRWKF